MLRFPPLPPLPPFVTLAETYRRGLDADCKALELETTKQSNLTSVLEIEMQLRVSMRDLLGEEKSFRETETLFVENELKFRLLLTRVWTEGYKSRSLKMHRLAHEAHERSLESQTRAHVANMNIIDSIKRSKSIENSIRVASKNCENLQLHLNQCMRSCIKLRQRISTWLDRINYWNDALERRASQEPIENRVERHFPINPVPCTSQQECSITFEEIPIGQACYVLKCTHVFSEAIVTWWRTEQQATCPLCRGPIE